MTMTLSTEDTTDFQPDPRSEKWRKQREHWDQLAQTMTDLFPAASTQYYRKCEIALIRRCFGSIQGKRVLKLDLWNEAVNTRILNWMESEGAQAFGMDISYATASRAMRQARRADRVGVALEKSDLLVRSRFESRLEPIDYGRVGGSGFLDDV